MEELSLEELNSKKSRSLIGFVESVVIEPDFLSKQYLKERQWVCVPVETGLHFTEDDTYRLSEVCRRLEVENCFAIATEELSIPKMFKFKASKKEFLRFNYECGGFDYAVVPEPMNFLISCSISDLFFLAGDKAFVEEVLGCSFEQGIRNFIEYATSVGISKKILDYYKI